MKKQATHDLYKRRRAHGSSTAQHLDAQHYHVKSKNLMRTGNCNACVNTTLLYIGIITIAILISTIGCASSNTTIEGCYKHIAEKDSIQLCKEYYVHTYLYENIIRKDTAKWYLKENDTTDKKIKAVRLLDFYCNQEPCSFANDGGIIIQANPSEIMEIELWIENDKFYGGINLTTPTIDGDNYTDIVYTKISSF